MKNLSGFILEKYKINKDTSANGLNIDDIINSIASYLDGDDFPLDAHGSKTGTGWKAAKKNGWWDVIEFCCGWQTISSDLEDITEEELYDFCEDNYDEITKGLKKIYKENKYR